MREYRYPLFYKWIYRYGNIPVTLIFTFYLLITAAGVDKHKWLLIPFIILLLLIYYVNKQFINLYKIVPYKIESDNEKIVCSKFLFSDKIITIYYKDVASLTGGIFDAKLSGLMKVCDGKSNICIGFFSKIKNINHLQTELLKNVKRKVYDDVMERVGKKTKRNKK